MPNKYPMLGHSGGPRIAGPNHLLGMVLGYSNSGKTCFITSHPDAFVINADMSSDVSPMPYSTRWPTLGKDGRALDENDKPMVLTWKSIMEKHALLIRLAKENQPRPSTIFLDSIGACIRLLKEHIVEHSNKSSWKELRGDNEWDTLYDAIVDFGISLHNHGYGVFYTCHLKDSYYKDGDNTVKDVDLTITPAFYQRLYPNMELVIAVHCERSKEVTTTNETVTVTGGGTRTIPRKKTVESKKVYAEVDSELLEDKLKTRVTMPQRIDLPIVGGWKKFEAVYEEGIQSTLEEAKKYGSEAKNPNNKD